LAGLMAELSWTEDGEDTGTEGRLRVDPPKNNQTALCKWASAYKL